MNNNEILYCTGVIDYSEIVPDAFKTSGFGAEPRSYFFTITPLYIVVPIKTPDAPIIINENNKIELYAQFENVFKLNSK
jgi:hypothetical protein